MGRRDVNINVIVVTCDDPDPPDEWCHNCVHFIPWEGDEEQPQNYNPCSGRMPVKFWRPNEYDEAFGFYLPGCQHREEPSP